MDWFTRHEAAKGPDGYWYVVRIVYYCKTGRVVCYQYDGVKRPLKEAEGVARKCNERNG